MNACRHNRPPLKQGVVSPKSLVPASIRKPPYADNGNFPPWLEQSQVHDEQVREQATRLFSLRASAQAATHSMYASSPGFARCARAWQLSASKAPAQCKRATHHAHACHLADASVVYVSILRACTVHFVGNHAMRIERRSASFLSLPCRRVRRCEHQASWQHVCSNMQAASSSQV